MPSQLGAMPTHWHSTPLVSRTLDRLAHTAKYMESCRLTGHSQPTDRAIKSGTAFASKRGGACSTWCERNQGDLMKIVGKLVVKMGLLSLLSVMPLAAQIDNGV